ncbi:MAG: rhomboid family intramembrane serine protease [Methylacidiphilales bacterium]|nr:rhomboid family intramembrane serine protease [Candidatus Methylacidiphilales bacterium]
MGLGLLRKTIGEQQTAQIWSKQFASAGKDGCACPMCSRAMNEITVEMPKGPLTLDVCQPCNFVWFDAGKCEYLPPPPPAPHILGQVDKSKMTQEQIESLAFIEAQRIAEEERKENPEPYEDWKTIPGLLGMPVELDADPSANIAWTTWFTAFVIAMMSIAEFFDTDKVIKQLGLIPNQAWRYFGLTFFTSFFLHAGAFHLISNLYFLIVFGRAVERDLGPMRWLLVLFISAFVGDFLDIQLDPRGDLPTIGASGGISGLLAYYTLKFPNASLGIMVRFVWVPLPAWLFFGLWILLQLGGAAQQIGGVGNVASLAHLGGVIAGVVFWLLWKDRPPNATSAPSSGAGQIDIKVH